YYTHTKRQKGAILASTWKKRVLYKTSKLALSSLPSGKKSCAQNAQRMMLFSLPFGR
ncbi:15466_t:CDS:1, partial [Gigaspora margarita]